MRTPAVMRRGGSFVWMAVAMLALGVGATTAIFSVVNGVMLRPLPFRDPGQLVLVGERVPSIPGFDQFAYFDTPSAFFAWQKRATDFTGLAALQGNSFTLAGNGRPRQLHGARVTVNFFDVLEVRPQLGRLFAPPDETDTSRPMVITDALWRSAFNADPGVIGRHVGVPGREARIVGVLPADFRLAGRELGPMLDGEPTDYFIPLYFDPATMGDDLTVVFGNFNYTVIGRLRPGVTQAHALAQLNVIQADLARTSPEKLPLYARLTTVRDYAVAEARQELWLLLAGVGAVLLIICVNLGGLWTTRIADRRRDWAIRAALGAAPGRLVRQILGESLVLALIGGGLGIACAAAGLHALLAMAPAGIPRLDEVRMDWRVLAFGVGLALVAGLVTGLVPALRLGLGDPQAALKGGGAATTADHTSLRSRRVLIGVQAALSTLLLVATGLLGLSFYQLMTRPTGFSTEHALTAKVIVNAYTDPQRDHILRDLPAALEAIPGVTRAAFTSHLPLQGETWIDYAGVPGKVYTKAEQPSVNVRFISPGYFPAVGIPLLAGRGLRESDRPAGWPPKDQDARAAMPGAVVLSRAAAHLLWPGVDPRDLVGRKIVHNDQPNQTVVGIAADALDGSLTGTPPAVLYMPYWEYPPYSPAVVLRTTLPPSALEGPFEAAVWRLAPDAPIARLEPLASLRAEAVAPQRYQLTLLLLFAAVALLLAATGVYALVAHSVTQRRKELAIRMAMGADSADLWRLVLRHALGPVAWGVAAGLVVALAARRVLASLLFDVSPANPAVLVAVAAAVLTAAVVASLHPAFRATRTDPIRALRSE
ncbi:MAG: ABC transporter permease [Acidobacteriota bacterium]|nr:ABC transporter permease [Acidobacteriota bacterium]